MKKVLLILTTIILSAYAVHAQPEHYSEEVRVVKPYNPMIDDAFKININPIIPVDSVKNDVSLVYKITPIKLTTDIEVSPIKAARMSGMPAPELYRLFLKTGFGNYTTPMFEVFYNSLRSRRSSYGLHYRHFSSNAGIPDYAYSGFSENALDLSSTLYGKNHVFNFKGGYRRDVVHFYGRPNSLANDTMERKEIMQRFHQASVGFHLKSDYGYSKKLNHFLGLQYDMINDHFASTEQGIQMAGGIDKSVTWFQFSREQTVGIDGSFQYYISRIDGDSLFLLSQPAHASLLNLNPYIHTKIKDMEFRVGAIVAYENANNGAIKFFPDIKLRISLQDQKFVLLGGLEGEMQHVGFQYLATENPFVTSAPEMRNTVVPVRVYGGLNAVFGPRINFNARVSSASMKNMPLFVADTSLLFQNRFNVIYDDGNLLTLKGELSYQAAEKIKVSGLIQYNDYNMVNELYAWHKSAFTAGIDIRYNLEDKILAHAGMQYQSGIKVKTFVKGIPEADNLKNILDINLGLEYRYTKMLSGFVQLNNLAASKYNRWQYYPAQRFNFLIGITYAL